MSEDTKFKAVVTGISNKVADKLMEDLNLKGTFIWKPTFNIYLPPEKEQEQFEQIPNEDEIVERAAEMAVKMLLAEKERLLALPESERLEAIAQASSASAHDVVRIGEFVNAEVEYSNIGEESSPVAPVPSTDLPKKTWPSNGEEG